MSTTADLIRVLKAELKSAGITYAALAAQLGMAESSVKRMFAQGDMPLSRIDAICRVLRTDFAELSRRLADEQPARMELTQEQERAVVADRRLLLAMIDKFDGGPVGVDSLAAAISEERHTIEDVLEPYLIQQGYVLRTPRGRMVTRAAYLHFGLQPRGTLATPDMLAGAAESP